MRTGAVSGSVGAPRVCGHKMMWGLRTRVVGCNYSAASRRAAGVCGEYSSALAYIWNRCSERSFTFFPQSLISIVLEDANGRTETFLPGLMSFAGVCFVFYLAESCKTNKMKLLPCVGEQQKGDTSLTAFLRVLWLCSVVRAVPAGEGLWSGGFGDVLLGQSGTLCTKPGALCGRFQWFPCLRNQPMAIAPPNSEQTGTNHRVGWAGTPRRALGAGWDTVPLATSLVLRGWGWMCGPAGGSGDGGKPIKTSARVLLSYSGNK